MTKYILSSDEKGSNAKEFATFKDMWDARWEYELIYGQYFIKIDYKGELKQ